MSIYVAPLTLPTPINQSIYVDQAVACSDIKNRGVQLVGTAHGMRLDDLLQNPSLSKLLGGVHTVVLGDEEARKRKVRSKSARERMHLPVFDIVIEARTRSTVCIYHDVSAAVDSLLRDEPPEFEMRTLLQSGAIQVKKSNTALDP